MTDLWLQVFFQALNALKLVSALGELTTLPQSAREGDTRSPYNTLPRLDLSASIVRPQHIPSYEPIPYVLNWSWS